MATVIKQGSDQTILIPNVVDATGAPLNPAGCSVKSQVRSRADNPVVLYEWTSPATATITTGTVTLTVSAAVSSAWTWSNGVYDVELTDAAGKTARIVDTTPIQVNPDTTR